jgi:hypothetical protein
MQLKPITANGRVRKIVDILAVVLFAVAFPAAYAISPADLAVQLSAQVQSPSQITLTWPAQPGTTEYRVSRKKFTDTAWGPEASLVATATSYVDTSAVLGAAYEYRVIRQFLDGTTTFPIYQGRGYIATGIEVPISESRGKVILVIDNTHTSALAAELARLEQDLVGDGWRVLRHDVARNETVPNVKALIQSDYNADPENVKAVFLIGHVPVPYSGDLAPDGHTATFPPNHQGAWPADAYYGEMNGIWTDSSVNNTSAARQENRNVPGDGKFDQSRLPDDVDLEVGRVDLANMPAFGLSETELLRRYLDKNHNFRHGSITVEPRALIDDNFGLLGTDAPAASCWRNFASFFGPSNVSSLDYLTTLSAQSLLWACGTGGGSYTSANGVGTTADFAALDPKAVFSVFYGSFFGDWDTENNFLRAPLATATAGLASMWVGRPHWYLHHMGIGETLGYATRLAQNNESLYLHCPVQGIAGCPSDIAYARQVHIALMGDPTLRLHPIKPPRDLSLTSTATGVQLVWEDDSPRSYYVYRAPGSQGPFVRLNNIAIQATTYTDPAGTAGGTYMVRAVKLQTSASGSYYNLSQGVFKLNNTDLAAMSVSTPPATIAQGWSFPVTDTIVNQGAVPVAGSNTRYFFRYAFWDPEQPLIGARSVPSLGPAASSAGTATVTVPSGMPVGVYRLWACADGANVIEETNEFNNCAGSPSPIQVTTPPNLIATSISNPPPTIMRNASFTVTDAYTNNGGATAPSSTTRYFLRYAFWDPEQPLTGARILPSLAPAVSSTGSVTVTVPANTPLGNYRLWVCANSPYANNFNGGGCRSSATVMQVK